jgi:hypothetical protein
MQELDHAVWRWMHHKKQLKVIGGFLRARGERQPLDSHLPFTDELDRLPSYYRQR